MENEQPDAGRDGRTRLAWWELAQRVLSAAMPDGHFVVVSKAHTHAYVKSKSANMLASHLGSGLDPKNHTMGSRAKKKKEFELVMIAQIPSC